MIQLQPDYVIRTTDTAPNVVFTLQDGTGAAVNLTGASVNLKLLSPSGAAVLNELAAILDAPNGKVQYIWDADDIQTPGRYAGFWVVTFQNGQIESFPDTSRGLWVEITGPQTGFQCLLGAGSWDAVRYVRGRIGDLDPPPFQRIPDVSMQDYVEATAEEWTKWVPLGDFVVGNPGANPITSPLMTVAYQQRYVLSPAFLAGVGLPPCNLITDVLYRIGTQILVGADLAFFLLIPSSPLGRFVLDPSSQATRVLRDDFLNELDHYGVGHWRRATDISGSPCIDLEPIPQDAPMPLLVRYMASHQSTALGDNYGSVRYSTVAEFQKRWFGDLLYANVLEDNAALLSMRTVSVAGMSRIQRSPAEVRALAEQIRTRTEQKLGSTTPWISRGELE